MPLQRSTSLAVARVPEVDNRVAESCACEKCRVVRRKHHTERLFLSRRDSEPFAAVLGFQHLHPSIWEGGGEGRTVRGDGIGTPAHPRRAATNRPLPKQPSGVHLPCRQI